MTERFLFRGKRIDNGEWAEGFYLDYLDVAHCIISTKLGGYVTLNEKDFAVPEWHEVDPATVSQCTGLRDRNGKLIFEGDIVTRVAPIYELGQKAPTGEYQPVGSVYVCEDGDEPPYYNIKSRDHRGNDANMLLFVKDSGWNRAWWVIGNVHDNPELLAEV